MTSYLDQIKAAEELINTLKEFPQYRQYVLKHQLKLIDSNMATFDEMLDEGIIKIK